MTARMLSADPIINSIYNTQAYNRFSYVWNNPLKFVDPMGYDGAPPYSGGGQLVGSGSYCTCGNSFRDESSPSSPTIGFGGNGGSSGSMDAHYRLQMMNSGMAALSTHLNSYIHHTNGYGSNYGLGLAGFGYNQTPVSSGAMGSLSAYHSRYSFRGSNFGSELYGPWNIPVAKGPPGDDQNGGDDNSSATTLSKVNTGIGAFDVGQGVKGELISQAAKSSPGINDLRYVKGVKVLGGVTFGTSAFISGGLTIYYYKNGGTNSSVWMKSALDVGMGYLGFLGPVGFGVSATYFLLDAGGIFKGWGDPLKTPKK